MKNKLREREREREREVTFLEWKKKCQIYSKILRIRRDKINEDKNLDKKWY